MSAKQAIYALDLGTTKFCIGRYLTGDLNPIDIVSIPAQGMERGMLANISLAKTALCELVEAAEKKFGDDILEVSVGIAGSHLRGDHVEIKDRISGPRVTGQDLDVVSQKAQIQFLENNREVLHLIPIQYYLDDRLFHEEPIGFSGSVLKIKFLKIDGQQSYLQDVMTLCNESGLKVRKFIAEPVASASVAISDEKKQYGVVSVDIGGGTADGLIYVNGKPWNIFTINIGGKLMTRDLCIGLGLSWESAENIKHKLGLFPIDKNQTCLAQTIHGQVKRLGWREIYPILGARAQELAHQINQHIGLQGQQITAGIVLTGGGSDVLGLERIIESRTHLYTVKGSPVFKSFEEQTEVYAPKFATVVGLLNMDLGDLVQNKNSKKSSMASRYLTSFVNWLKELS